MRERSGFGAPAGRSSSYGSVHDARTRPRPQRRLAASVGVGVWTEAGWVVLSTDGWVATPAGPIDAAGSWRRGVNEEEIAGAIHEQLGS